MMGAVANEAEAKEEQELREEGGGEDSRNLESSSSFLSELNLLLVFLSLISPSSDEDSNGDNDAVMRLKELKASKACNITRPSVKKKDVIEAKPEAQRIPQRLHTTIKDHRHGRKM